MAIPALDLSLGFVEQMNVRGTGMLAGTAPDSEHPEEVDGRFKVMNVPARGKVLVLDRRSFRCVRAALSNPDGTWVVHGLSADRYYCVVGVDGTGAFNASIQDWVRPHVPEP